MDPAIPYHFVDLGYGLTCCVGVRPTQHGLEILIDPGVSDATEHDCQFYSQPTSLTLPAPFEPLPSRIRINAAMRRLIAIDGQALKDLRRGIVVRKQVSVTDPHPLDLASDAPTLSAYGSMRLTAADLVRPILLAIPSEERLRPFQIEGSRWLIQRDKAILADDMGLGKTVQTIAALRVLFNEGRIFSSLIVCPKSLLANWEEELSSWSPELARLRVTPQPSIREQVWKAVWGKVHILLTNYEQLRTTPLALRQSELHIVVADEAHRIRNADSQTAQGIRRLGTKRFWALTGTPIERDPEDLATMLATLEPDRSSVTDKRLHPSSLRSQARPYVLRRLKADVLDELPRVLESVLTLELLPDQRESYSRVLRGLSKSDGASTLATINRLRAICDYDSRSGQSAKVDRIIEIVQDVATAGEKSVVFSYLLEPLTVLRTELERLLGRETVIELRGSMSATDRTEAIQRFKHDTDVHSILCSTRVAGEGLTLTEANHVIFLNQWWNPSANAQARDRVVRIGQRKGVRVYQFKCKHTIEETLESILARKSRDFARLIDRLAEPGPSIEELTPILSGLKEEARVIGTP